MRVLPRMVKNRIIKGGGILDSSIIAKVLRPQRAGCLFFPIFGNLFLKTEKKP